MTTRGWLLVLSAGVFISLAAIDGRSFWIDEAGTYVLLDAPASSVIQRVIDERGSTSQMPLHAAYGWAWQRYSGRSERLLRLSNLPWFVMGLVGLAAGFRKRPFVLGLSIMSPFLWYYLNEYRSYTMQWAGACLAMGPLLLASRDEAAASLRQPGRAAVAALGFVVLASASLLGAMWCAAVLTAWVLWLPARWYRSIPRGTWAVAGVAVVLLAGLACYYAMLLTLGARAAAIESPGWKEALFAGYELAGLAGFGPGRLSLRETGGAALAHVRYLAPTLLAAGSVATLFGAALRGIWRRGQVRALGVLAVLLAPGILLAVIGPLLHFRVLGRHLTPALVPLTVILAEGAHDLWVSGGRRVLVWLPAVLLSTACAQIRLAPRHGKDDYRSAARIARQASEARRTVWWVASTWGAAFYGVELGDVSGGSSARTVGIVNPDEAELASLARPDVVLISKADLFDRNGAVGRYLRQHAYVRKERLPAFAVWVPSAADAGATNTTVGINPPEPATRRDMP